ncbi:MAG: hypothetical protein EOL95_11330 [Bacteroidia bacterium]|nr:hypothetical protein [Bacteroidia bacterium]
MAIRLASTFKNALFSDLLDDAKYGDETLLFKIFDSTDTLKDSFTKSVSYFKVGGGDVEFNTSTGGNLVFTIPPSTTDIYKIELWGDFTVGSAAGVLAKWVLEATPTDERLDYPNGGTCALAQWVMSLSTE